MEQGFIKLVLIIIVAIIVLSYFGISIRGLFESESSQSNFSYVWNATKSVWNNYLVGPVEWVWNNFFIDLIWEPFVNAMSKIKEGSSPDIMDNGPTVK